MIHTDVLVVGCGPAGLGAAVEAARCGASVLAVDENRKPGGQLYKQIHKFFGSGAHYAGTRGFQIADQLTEEARTRGVKILLDARAQGLLDCGQVSLLTNLAGHTSSKLETVTAKKIILATGARENALAFPGWDLPGVMTAGAAQTFANVHGVLPGKNILVVGSGNVGLIVSYQLMQAGAHIAALVEAAPSITGYQVHAGKLQRAGVPIYTGHTIAAARGTERVTSAVITRVDTNFQPVPGTARNFSADSILLAVGLNPRADLPAMFHCAGTYEGALGGLVPVHDGYMRSSSADVYVCGDLAGVEEASTALEEGRLAGLHAALALNHAPAGAAARIAELQGSLRALRGGKQALRRLECKSKLMEKGGAFYAQ